MTDNRDSYNANADFWTQIIREQHDKFRTELTNDAVLQAIGDVTGLTALDAGCGEGYMSRTLAEGGAKVTGIDFSDELIRAAREHSLTPELPVTFDVGDVSSLPYDPGTFDLVLCNHLLNDLEHPSQAIKEFSRVLSPQGRIVIMMLHPCFYNKHSEREELDNNTIASTYFETRSATQHFVVNGITSPSPNTAWIRPLEFYTQTLQDSGLAIRSLSEPHPSKQQLQNDRWWSTSFTRPLFMLIVAQRWPQ